MLRLYRPETRFPGGLLAHPLSKLQATKVLLFCIFTSTITSILICLEVHVIYSTCIYRINLQNLANAGVNFRATCLTVPLEKADNLKVAKGEECLTSLK